MASVRIAATCLLCCGGFALGLAYPPASIAVDRATPSVGLGARPATPMLRLGSRGPEVRALQSSLAQLTYLPSGGIDGVFGMQTWHAVVALQGWSSLPRDGIVGPRTLSVLAHARPRVTMNAGLVSGRTRRGAQAVEDRANWHAAT